MMIIRNGDVVHRGRHVGEKKVHVNKKDPKKPTATATTMKNPQKSNSNNNNNNNNTNSLIIIIIIIIMYIIGNAPAGHNTHRQRGSMS